MRTSPQKKWPRALHLLSFAAPAVNNFSRGRSHLAKSLIKKLELSRWGLVIFLITNY